MPSTAHQLIGREEELARSSGFSTPASSYLAPSCSTARPGSGRRRSGWPASTQLPSAAIGCCVPSVRGRDAALVRGSRRISWRGRGRRPAGAAADPAASARDRTTARRVGDRALTSARSPLPSSARSDFSPRRPGLPRYRRSPVARRRVARGSCGSRCRASTTSASPPCSPCAASHRLAPARLPETRLVTVEIGGLSLGATARAAPHAPRATFPRPTLVRLWRRRVAIPSSRSSWPGAPAHGGALAPGAQLPIPATLDELLRAPPRWPQRRQRSRSARVVAAVADPTVDPLEAVLGAASDAALAETFDAGILELDGSRLRFTHPLLGSAVAARQTPPQRRALHARLASSCRPTRSEHGTSPSRRREPDREIATILEAGGAVGARRGAPAAAAELAEQAVRLTPPEDPAEAGGVYSSPLTGTTPPATTSRAIALLEQARAPRPRPASSEPRSSSSSPPSRDDHATGEALYQQALAEAGGRRRARGHDPPQPRRSHALRRGRRARPRPRRAGRPRRLARRRRRTPMPCARDPRAGAFQRRARHSRRARWRRPRARASTDRVAARRTVRRRCSVTSSCWSGDWTARESSSRSSAMRSTRETTRRRGRCLWYLGLLEWRAGNWEEADGIRGRAGWSSGRNSAALTPLDEFPGAVVAAHRGRIDDARRRAHARDRPSRGRRESGRISRLTAGCSASSSSRSATRTGARAPETRRTSIRNAVHARAGMRLELGDLLEALIAVGELDEADEILATWEARAAPGPGLGARDPRALPRVALAARGDLDGAFASFERALAEHARSTDPFHHARTLLALGRTQRRAKKRGAARATLEDASLASRRSAHPSGPSRHAPSSPGSAAARRRAAS